jgi:hypothetical protein
MTYMQSRAAAGELVTGLIYLDANASDMHAALNTVDHAAQYPWRKGVVSRLGSFGKNQRVLALIAS